MAIVADDALTRLTVTALARGTSGGQVRERGDVFDAPFRDLAYQGPITWNGDPIGYVFGTDPAVVGAAITSSVGWHTSTQPVSALAAASVIVLVAAARRLQNPNEPPSALAFTAATIVTLERWQLPFSPLTQAVLDISAAAGIVMALSSPPSTAMRALHPQLEPIVRIGDGRINLDATLPPATL